MYTHALAKADLRQTKTKLYFVLSTFNFNLIWLILSCLSLIIFKVNLDLYNQVCTKTNLNQLWAATQFKCNKYSPSGGVFIAVKYRLPKSAASGEKAGTGLQPWLAADAFLRRSRACPGRQCVQRSAPARDSSSCSLSGAGVWDQRCAAGTR